eukprot:6491259-Amphidinium_carterae.1
MASPPSCSRRSCKTTGNKRGVDASCFTSGMQTSPVQDLVFDELPGAIRFRHQEVLYLDVCERFTETKWRFQGVHVVIGDEPKVGLRDQPNEDFQCMCDRLGIASESRHGKLPDLKVLDEGTLTGQCGRLELMAIALALSVRNDLGGVVRHDGK